MIVVLAADGGSVMREVLAGIEEEGVPAAAPPVDGADRGVSAADLAQRAAMLSPLQVGVGIGAPGDIRVCHAKLGQPVFGLPAGSSPSAARTMGHNAARIVAGLPLKDLADPDLGPA